ncbi:CPXCG motif-containing cysteine-rich protein [Aliikangiella coralliicola]|uniref:CPXCG motif-containing cysteine-rich protein n=1 Tax=Aliikangiella coralliicola TaxID=2592383 RepID=A0A545UFF6_9GAMM|nr:CPXCG motif-containing cysteine-rich protein [Aliikangiella coralliicola]TQV88202.1 CPXCG motif-containing cysteine-rich protein [Aliikangiella coralliicola]
MVNQLKEAAVQCPYCWEQIEVLIDCSVDSQSYVEDCQVCCRPIVFDISIDEFDNFTVEVKSEDD